MDNSNSEPWRDIAKRKQAEVRSKIPSAWLVDPCSYRGERNILPLLESCGILSPLELEMVHMEDATALLEKMHTGQWAAEDVTVAFCKRAAVAHQTVNCLMDMAFDEAIARAQELDKEFRYSGKPIGPLHGLPVSIKDLLAVKDMQYTVGYVAWADRVASEDAIVVEALRDAGAVIYAKTTATQSAMALETVSNLFGRTVNPRNTDQSTGGSSGGEAALIACRGSLLGIGTDSGGSIRIPAAFNGLYGLKTTSTRLSCKGNKNITPSLGIASCIGPVARSVRDLQLLMRVLLAQEPWLKDSAVVEKPWADTKRNGPFNIGIVEWDETVMPHPPILRATRTAREKIAAAGNEVIDLSMYRHDDGESICRRLYRGRGTTFIQRELDRSGEPPIEALKLRVNKKPWTFDEVRQAHDDAKAFKDDYLEWWMGTAKKTHNGRPIDALLLPVTGSTGLLHDEIPYWNYVTLQNLVDYPAVTIPVTTVDKTIDEFDLDYEPVTMMDEVSNEGYDPEAHHGMPVCLQLVSRSLNEETLLAVAAAVDRALKA